nr:hypothetical protein Q903MT_gene4671 [Picea sitchensis]
MRRFRNLVWSSPPQQQTWIQLVFYLMVPYICEYRLYDGKDDPMDNNVTCDDWITVGSL